MEELGLGLGATATHWVAYLCAENAPIAAQIASAASNASQVRLPMNSPTDDALRRGRA